MKHFAGLDVSLKAVSICVVDADGGVVALGTAPADPQGIAGWFRNRSSRRTASSMKADSFQSGCNED